MVKMVKMKMKIVKSFDINVGTIFNSGVTAS